MVHFVRAVSCALCSAALACLLASGTWGADRQWELSSMPSVTSGDYGTGTNTTAIYLPFTVKRLFKKGDLGLTVPFESITGNGAVTFLGGGTPNQTGGMAGGGSAQAGGAMGAAAQMMPPGQPGQQNGAGRFTGSSERTTNSGLGDLVLHGRYDLLEEGDWGPSVDVTSRVKFPTANSDKGLGTGKFDEGLGAEFSKELIGDFSATASAGYTFVGSPAGEELRDGWDYSLGFEYDFSKTWEAGLTYQEARALIAGDPNPQDIAASLDYRLTKDTSVIGSATAGLSKGSPDFGFTLGIVRKI